MAPRPYNRTPRTRTGFTLAELLVAVAIIIILAALLLPALNKAYRSAMRAADQSLLAQISMGCEAYYKTFNEYPTSRWESALPAGYTTPVTGVAANLVWPPPPFGAGKSFADTPFLSGAAKVFSSLVGFDAVGGVPGCADPDPANWQNSCGTLTYRSTVNKSGKEYPAYFLPSEKQQTRVEVNWSGTIAEQSAFASRFSRTNPSSPAETTAPILYYRAIRTPASKDIWDVFRYGDNYLITDRAGSLTGGVEPYNSTLGNIHPLYASATGEDVDNNIVANRITLPDSLDYGIARPRPAGSTTRIPYNADSFILISPGPDGEYFTEDDVRNF